jgi:hypothetical protein
MAVEAEFSDTDIKIVQLTFIECLIPFAYYYKV